MGVNMPQRLISLSELSNSAYANTAESIIINVETHPDTPKETPKPYPTVQDVRASFTKFKDLFHAAENGDRIKMEQRNTARKVSQSDIYNYGHFLMTSGMDIQYLHEVGILAKQSPGKKNARANASSVQPGNVKIAHGKNSGELVLKCSPHDGANMMDVEMATDPSAEANWVHVNFFPHASKMEVTGLEPGKKYYFRVRYMGGNGPGPWAELVSLICM